MLIGLAAALSGTALWQLSRAPSPSSPTATNPALRTPEIAPSALHAATFVDPAGRRHTLGEFAGQLVVLNFWATWCAPCRAEMPAFERLHQQWGQRRVQFVGLSAESPDVAARFAREVGVTYPLWTGGDEVHDLSRRLGNHAGVLPHTVILSPSGTVLDQKVGPYTDLELHDRLTGFAAKRN